MLRMLRYGFARKIETFGETRFYGEMHHQQILSRLVPIKEFTSKPIELHDGRHLVDQDYWRVQIGR